LIGRGVSRSARRGHIRTVAKEAPMTTRMRWAAIAGVCATMLFACHAHWGEHCGCEGDDGGDDVGPTDAPPHGSIDAFELHPDAGPTSPPDAFELHPDGGPLDADPDEPDAWPIDAGV
jgi:hypothetical protein